MTNPIMPGIEKLAEKYGIDVSNNSKIITMPNVNFFTDVFKIEVYKNHFFINNVKNKTVNENFCSENLIVSFGILDNCKRHSIYDWLDYEDYRTIQDTALNYDIPNSQTIFNVLNKLRENKNGQYKKDIEFIRNKIEVTINHRKLITNTTLLYNSGLKTKINHYNPRTNNHEYQIDFPNSSIEIKNGRGLDEITKYLTGLTIDDLNKTSEWLVSKTTYLNINSFIKPRKRVLVIDFDKKNLVIDCKQSINNEFSSLGVKEI